MREEEKASLVPSADQAGERLVPPNLGNATSRFRSREYIRISQPVFVAELNARREPSGAIRGDREIEPTWVIACWFAPS